MSEWDNLGELNAKDNDVRFSTRRHPIEAILSIAFAGLSLIAGIIAVIISTSLKGKAGNWSGLVGVLSLIACATGLVLAVMCYHKEDVRLRIANLGAILNGALTILYLIVFINGAVS